MKRQKIKHIKIVLPQNTVGEVDKYFKSQGPTEEYLFPITKLDEIVSVKS